eukprot:768514-Pleurochrysis_carterae.AAC.3
MVPHAPFRCEGHAHAASRLAAPHMKSARVHSGHALAAFAPCMHPLRQRWLRVSHEAETPIVRVCRAGTPRSSARAASRRSEACGSSSTGEAKHD